MGGRSESTVRSGLVKQPSELGGRLKETILHEQARRNGWRKETQQSGSGPCGK